MLKPFSATRTLLFGHFSNHITSKAWARNPYLNRLPIFLINDRMRRQRRKHQRVLRTEMRRSLTVCFLPIFRQSRQATRERKRRREGFLDEKLSKPQLEHLSFEKSIEIQQQEYE